MDGSAFPPYEHSVKLAVNPLKNTAMDPQLSAIAQLLERQPAITLAYVFGSLATGSATPGSDADIAVQALTPLDASTRMQLTEALAGVTGRPIDLIDLRTAGEPLLGQILKNGIRIKGDDVMHAELMTRHVFAMEDFYPYVQRMLKERREQWIK